MFSLAIGLNEVHGHRLNVVLLLPSTVVVAEILPLAKVFRGPIRLIAVQNDSLDIPPCLLFLLYAFFVKVDGFNIFLGKTRKCKASFPLFMCLDIVVNALDAFETLEELVGFVGVVEVREVFPLDMKALLKSINICAGLELNTDDILGPNIFWVFFPPFISAVT